MRKQTLDNILRLHGALRTRAIVGALCATFLCGAGVSAVAQQAAAPSTANLFHDQARKLGAQKCTALYAALGQGVTQGAAFAVKTETNKDAPDAHMMKGIVGMTYNLPDLKGPAGGVVLAAPAAQGCEGYLVRVAPFQKPCAQVVPFLPAGSVAEQPLSGVPQYRLGGNQGQALMIASGSSCVVVTMLEMAQRG